MKCECEDWKENIDKINGPLSFIQITKPDLAPAVPVKQFAFCPWCGRGLFVEPAVALDPKRICGCGDPKEPDEKYCENCTFAWRH